MHFFVYLEGRYRLEGARIFGKTSRTNLKCAIYVNIYDSHDSSMFFAVPNIIRFLSPSLGIRKGSPESVLVTQSSVKFTSRLLGIVGTCIDCHAMTFYIGQI